MRTASGPPSARARSPSSIQLVRGVRAFAISPSIRYRMETMRLPNEAHTSRPWRIHEITPDFRVEDVWALPTPGGPDDFPRLIDLAAGLDPENSNSRIVRTLFALRWKLGEVFGWDGPGAGLDSRVPTLRDRLPADLR